MEKRGRAAALAIIVPTGMTQPSESRCSAISFDVSDCMEELMEEKMEPELGEFESSSTGTGFEAPGQQCLLNWEMERTTVDGCLLVDGSSDLGETTFSLKEFVIGAQTDSSIASSKIIFLQMSSKTKDKELANEENKQFDPGGKVREPPLCKADVLVFLFPGELWAWMSGLFLLCFSGDLFRVGFVFCCRKNQVVILCDLRKTWEERRSPMETRTKPMKTIPGEQAFSCPSAA